MRRITEVRKVAEEWKLWNEEEEVAKSEEEMKKWIHMFGKKQSERMLTRKL